MTIEDWHPYKSGEANKITTLYHARSMAVGIINRQIAAKQFAEKPDDRFQEDLDSLITQYNIGVDFNSCDYLEQNRATFQNALTAIVFNTRVEFAGRVFQGVVRATKPGNKNLTEVLITDSLTLDDRYDEIFALAQRQLNAAGETGAILACNDIVEAVGRQDIPLLGYTHAVASRMANLNLRPDGSLAYTFPTALPNVDARYIYGPDDDYATSVSLIVKPFEQG